MKKEKTVFSANASEKTGLFTKENKSKNEHFKLSQNVKYKTLKGIHNNIEDNPNNVGS